MINFDFRPNAQRAKAIDQRMLADLGRSLAYLNSACTEKIVYNQHRLKQFAKQLQEGGIVSPTTFAKYYKLVISIQDEQYDVAQKFFDELANTKFSSREMSIYPLGDPDYFDESQIYHDLMISSEDNATGFAKPTKESAKEFIHRLQDSLQLLEDVIPELAQEIKAIVRHIIIIGSDPTKPYQVDGGSHYQLWGALFINGSYHNDAVAIAEVLAHESAHSLLFGFTTDEALVNNDDDELYPSPLRVDPRPMDGIYHATYVSARMHWAMTQLAASDKLTPEQKNRARKSAELDVKNFNAGYGVVAEHGRLTNTGNELMKSAKDYMSSIH